MESKYLTKTNLISVNNRARKAGGNYIDPDFVALIPDRFKYPVWPAVPHPVEMGWMRCWVMVGPPDGNGCHNFLVDMPGSAYAKLPSGPELAEVEEG